MVTEEEIARAMREAMKDEYAGKPCGCIIEAGCEARGYIAPVDAAEAFIAYAARAVLALVQPALTRAVEAERERCAVLVETQSLEWYGAHPGTRVRSPKEIATAIRSRARESEAG